MKGREGETANLIVNVGSLSWVLAVSRHVISIVRRRFDTENSR